MVNLSLGDDWRPAGHYPSPLARLLDWLAFKYKILFVVSAGNYGELTLNLRWDVDLSVLSDEERRETVLRALYESNSARRLLTPAESVNAITVGALHDDATAAPAPGKLIDPYQCGDLPNPMTAQGPGFRRAVKPDIHAPGGRQLYLPRILSTQDPLTLRPTRSFDPPGQRAAIPPSSQSGSLNEVAHTCGTSNAAAIITRTVARQYDQLLEYADLDIENAKHRDRVAPLLKALAVHRATWGTMREHVGNAVDDATKDGMTRLLGYGSCQGEPIIACTDHRATVMAYGLLHDGDGHHYDFPIPSALSGAVGWRRLVVTLAWLTPINPHHRSYRGAALWFERFRDNAKDDPWKGMFGVEQVDVDWQTARRGTLQHEVWQGSRPIVVEDNTTLPIKINCREDAGPLHHAVPYGLVVTMEVAPETGVSIYDAIRTRLRQRTPVRPRV